MCLFWGGKQLFIQWKRYKRKKGISLGIFALEKMFFHAFLYLNRFSRAFIESCGHIRRCWLSFDRVKFVWVWLFELERRRSSCRHTTWTNNEIMWQNNGPWYRSSSRLIERESKKRKKRKGFKNISTNRLWLFCAGQWLLSIRRARRTAVFSGLFYSVLVCWGLLLVHVPFFFFFFYFLTPPTHTWWRP